MLSSLCYYCSIYCISTTQCHINFFNRIVIFISVSIFCRTYRGTTRLKGLSHTSLKVLHRIVRDKGQPQLVRDTGLRDEGLDPLANWFLLLILWNMKRLKSYIIYFHFITKTKPKTIMHYLLFIPKPNWISLDFV